ncbi:hypothetical protein THRCLA_02081 [Thraustotheca clavata]|uniref:LRAT domain-containing protein n=1 Tax=Thraustotheca clavata TaxID=74557 RepID=A0A1W0A6B0_9STRA|nr:hypothetical protein THRCLA_02081 [Thraustotheca clavata]
MFGGEFTKVKNISSLRPADHIAVWDKSRWPIKYQHHGIVWASGDTEDTVQICHVWSPLIGYKEAQADSCFRISTLKEFLFNRSLASLRVVEYHTSSLREILSKWGEVHYTRADLPEVILARCKFLMGLGKGEFNIFKQNCEHAAHWCMTGEQWCKQNLTRAKGRVPFENMVSPEQVNALYDEIDAIKAVSKSVVDKVLSLNGRDVHIRVNGVKDSYLAIISSGFIGVVESRDEATSFQVATSSKVYNSMKVSFQVDGKHMYSRSTLSCYRQLHMKKYNFWRGRPGMTWELSSNGYMKSMNQHRRYIGIRSDNILVDVSMRGDAGRFELIPVEEAQVSPAQYDAKISKIPSARSFELAVNKSMRNLEARRSGKKEMVENSIAEEDDEGNENTPYNEYSKSPATKNHFKLGQKRMNMDPLQLVFTHLLTKPIHSTLDEKLHDIDIVHETLAFLPREPLLEIVIAMIAYVNHTRSLLNVCQDYLHHHINQDEVMEQIALIIPFVKDTTEDEGADDSSDVFLSPRNEPTIVPWSEVSSLTTLKRNNSWWSVIQSLWMPTQENEDDEDVLSTEEHDEYQVENLPLDIVNTVSSMVEYPANLKLQLNGLEALANYTNSPRCESQALLYVNPQMMPATINAMKELVHSKRAQIAGLSLLANPNVSLPSTITIQQCRRIILTVMRRYESHAQIQGLSCISLANLCREPNGALDIVSKGGVDAAILAMKHCPEDATVQSAGSCLIATICSINEEMQYAVLDAGGVAIIEKCLRLFPNDERVQEYGQLALTKINIITTNRKVIWTSFAFLTQMSKSNVGKFAVTGFVAVTAATIGYIHVYLPYYTELGQQVHDRAAMNRESGGSGEVSQVSGSMWKNMRQQVQSQKDKK